MEETPQSPETPLDQLEGEALQKAALDIIHKTARRTTKDVLESVEAWRTNAAEAPHIPRDVLVTDFARTMMQGGISRKDLCLAIAAAINLLSTLPPAPKDHDPLKPLQPKG